LGRLVVTRIGSMNGNPSDLKAIADIITSTKTLIAAIGGSGLLSSLVTLMVAHMWLKKRNGNGLKSSSGFQCPVSGPIIEAGQKMDKMIALQSEANTLLKLLVNKEMSHG